MPILKHRKQTGYVQISNILAQNTELSYEALGVLVNLLSRPDDWIVHKTSFRNSHCGEIMLNRIFKELQEAGYLKLTDERVNGKIVNRIWIVSDEPMLSSENELKNLQNLNTGKPQDEETSSRENHVLQRKNNTNKEKSFTKKDTAENPPSSFLDVWNNIYPHNSDRGSKEQARRNWDNLLKAGVIEQDLYSSAVNYRKFCDIKHQEQYKYKCSNFYGKAKYYEGFIIISEQQIIKEVMNESNSRSSKPLSYGERAARGADNLRELERIINAAETKNNT